MKPFLIVHNIKRQGPGYMLDCLKEREIPYEVVDLGAGDEFPALDGYSGFMLLGAPIGANDDTDLMHTEIARVKEAVEIGMPYYGSCLGAQILSKATGGKVYPNHTAELGWRDGDNELYSIELTDEGKKDPLFHELEDSYIPVFHYHGDTFDLSPGMRLLARGKTCEHQVVKMGESAYGVQPCFQMNEYALKSLLENDPTISELGHENVMKEFESANSSHQYEEIHRRLFSNFLSILS